MKTHTITLPNRSERMPQRPSRITDKDGNLLFAGTPTDAERFWGELLKRSGILNPPTKEEANALRAAKRRGRYRRTPTPLTSVKVTT